MPNTRAVYCPYYITRSTADKRMATITCANIENHLGFDIKNQIVFDAHTEKENYVGIFCADMFDTCPYYRAIYGYDKKKGESDNEKDQPCPKGKNGRTQGKGCQKEDV